MNTFGLSRRGFVSASLGSLLAAGLPEWFAREILADEQEKTAKEKKVSANDKITFGVIGSGDRFQGGLLGDMRRHQGWQMVAACDVDKSHVESAAKKIGGEVKTYGDFRELCARTDIDAVVIATPDHWHTIPAICAAKSGKDIYLEKPMTLTIAEGRPLIKAVRDNKRILQVGSQQRSDARFRLACELVRNGRIGKLHTVETRIGGAPKGGPFKEEEPPMGLDWDFWLGQTTKVPYIKQRCHYEFRWWYEYSGGKGTDWGAHHNDIAHWAMGMDENGPLSVESEGEAPKVPNGYNCHTKFRVTFKYPNDVTVICMSDGENGVLFKGDKGEIFVSRGTIRGSKEELIKEPLHSGDARLYTSNNHMGNFFECLRSRKDPICPVTIGHSSVTACHIANISLRLGGRKLQWNAEKELFFGEGSDEANKMVSREMRAPWKIDV